MVAALKPQAEYPDTVYHVKQGGTGSALSIKDFSLFYGCLLYTSDAADE